MPDQINEKTSIPLGWAATIIVSLVSLISSAAVGNYRLSNVEKGVEEAKSKAESKDVKDQTKDLRLQRVEDKVDTISEAVGRIEKSINRENSRR